MFRSKIGLTITLLTLSCFLPLISKLAVASLLEGYNPPTTSESIDQRTTVGSGTRSLSCQKLFKKGSLTLLVPPEEIVHHTVSSHPSFYLYAQATSTVPLKFSLVIPEPTAKNPIVEGTLVIERPGVYQIQLPAEVELETGQVYLWRIGIPCGDNPQKIEQVIKAAVKRVPVSAQLSTQLELANSPLEKAQSYASSGIWYDAFSLAVKQAQYSSESVDYVRKLGQEVVGINLETQFFSSVDSIP